MPRNTSSSEAIKPTILTRDQHPVSRKFMSANALKVLSRLNYGGYKAYLVGGGVRDILLGVKPKDFDIATNATPEEIKALFRNCRLIGRRFRLAHIVFGRDIIEVATFRGHHENAEPKEQNCQKTSKQNDQGMLLRDNIYGSIEEDAERRDFTINALYYSADVFTVHDFANGIADIEAKQIRLIGDPETRYREDPVRMLRAIRFATKLDMTISPETMAPISALAPLLENIPPARMFEEFSKIFLNGKACENFDMLRSFNLFKYFFPAIDTLLNGDDSEQIMCFIQTSLKNTDERINNHKGVNPAFLFAAFLWFPLQKQVALIKKAQNLSPQDTFFAALNVVMPAQQQSIAIPKRLQSTMKDIWILQDKLVRREGKRAEKTFEHQAFRAGYDFLLLRTQIEDSVHSNDSKAALTELAKWWTDYQTVTPETKLQMVKKASAPRTRTRRTLRKRSKPANSSSEAE